MLWVRYGCATATLYLRMQFFNAVNALQHTPNIHVVHREPPFLGKHFIPIQIELSQWHLWVASFMEISINTLMYLPVRIHKPNAAKNIMIIIIDHLFSSFLCVSSSFPSKWIYLYMDASYVTALQIDQFFFCLYFWSVYSVCALRVRLHLRLQWLYLRQMVN